MASAARRGRRRYRVTSSAAPPRPSIAKRIRLPGAGNMVVLLLRFPSP